MLIQIITVDRSKRPEHEVRDLARRLEARGHDVVIQRFPAARPYAGNSADVGEVVGAIWESDRACFEYARQRRAPYTLILEDDCEIDELGCLDTAEAFIAQHPGEVDMFFLGASPNCWWTTTADDRVVKYSHVYWWHAVIFTRSFKLNPACFKMFSRFFHTQLACSSMVFGTLPLGFMPTSPAV